MCLVYVSKSSLTLLNKLNMKCVQIKYEVCSVVLNDFIIKLVMHLDLFYY